MNRAIKCSEPATQAIVTVRVFGVLLAGLCLPAALYAVYWVAESVRLWALSDRLPGPEGHLYQFVTSGETRADVWAWTTSTDGAMVAGFAIGCVLISGARWAQRLAVAGATGVRS